MLSHWGVYHLRYCNQVQHTQKSQNHRVPIPWRWEYVGGFDRNWAFKGCVSKRTKQTYAWCKNECTWNKSISMSEAKHYITKKTWTLVSSQVALRVKGHLHLIVLPTCFCAKSDLMCLKYIKRKCAANVVTNQYPSYSAISRTAVIFVKNVYVYCNTFTSKINCSTNCVNCYS